MDESTVIACTRRWIAEVVIGLNLCPFARRVFETDKIRYVVSAAPSEEALSAHLRVELETLAATPTEDVETTLLIHPHACRDFLAFNEFLGVAAELLAEVRLKGTIQIASFHPGYQFAGTHPGAAENYTNRSPFPMLHLLRETSFDQAGDRFDLLEIPRRNAVTMATLGATRLRTMLEAIAAEPSSTLPAAPASARTRSLPG